MRSSSSSSKLSFLSSSEYLGYLTHNYPSFVMHPFHHLLILFPFIDLVFRMSLFMQLYGLPLFPPLSNSHNQKVQMHMLDLMSSIIMEGDGVTQELLDTILINLIPAHKVANHTLYCWIIQHLLNPIPSQISNRFVILLFLFFRTWISRHMTWPGLFWRERFRPLKPASPQWVLCVFTKSSIRNSLPRSHYPWQKQLRWILSLNRYT